MGTVSCSNATIQVLFLTVVESSCPFREIICFSNPGLFNDYRDFRYHKLYKNCYFLKLFRIKDKIEI